MSDPVAKQLEVAPDLLDITNKICEYVTSVDFGKGAKMFEWREVDDMIRAEFARQGIDNIATKERDEFHPVTFYVRHFGMFIADIFGPESGARSIKVEYSDRDNVQSGYWVTIQWTDGDGQLHFVESQWHKLAWERAMKEFDNSLKWKHSPDNPANRT